MKKNIQIKFTRNGYHIMNLDYSTLGAIQYAIETHAISPPDKILTPERLQALKELSHLLSSEILFFSHALHRSG